VYEPNPAVDWNAFAREWLRANGVPGNLVLLTEGPSEKNPWANNRMEIIDLTSDPGEKR